MGKQMIQQKGIIRTGVSWFSSHIKRYQRGLGSFFHREDEAESKRNHLQELYDRYERQSKERKEKKAQKAAKHLTGKSEVLEIVLKRLRNEPNLSQKYLARRNKIKEYLESREPFDRHNELVCPICMEYFIDPVPTICGHAFCLRCLDNALLFKGGCPVCRASLRGQDLSPCLALNSIVQMHVEKACKPEQIETYRLRLRDVQELQAKKRLNPSMLTVGERVDVRDTEYIWCRGFILNVYRRGDIVTEVLIHYQGWNKIYDEILEVTSPRIASLGFYTNREDIPRYAINDNSQTYYSYVVSGPHQPPAVENPPAADPADEAANEEPSAQEQADNSGSEPQSEIEVELNLNNRINQATRVVRNITVSSVQQRLLLRNILNEMGLGSIGNMINFEDDQEMLPEEEQQNNAQELPAQRLRPEQPEQAEQPQQPVYREPSEQDNLQFLRGFPQEAPLVLGQIPPQMEMPDDDSQSMLPEEPIRPFPAPENPQTIPSTFQPKPTDNNIPPQ